MEDKKIYINIFSKSPFFYDFIIKEKNIFNSAFNNYKGIDLAIQELAAFHGTEEIVETG